MRAGGSGAGGRHARGRPDRAVGPAAVPTRPDLSGSRCRAPPCRARPDAPHRRSRRRLHRAHGPRRRTAPRRRAVGGLRAVGRDQVARRRRDRRRRGDEPGGDGGRPGRRGPGAVGVRAALLPRRVRRPADDRVVGRDPLARLPRLRLGLPRARGAGQPRRRGRRARRPRRGRPCSPVVGRLRRCAPPIRAARSNRPPARRAARRLAQDGDGGNGPGARSRAAGRRRGRARQPAPGRGDLRGPGQRAGGRRGRPRMPGVLRPPSTARSWRSATPPSTRRMPPSRPRSCGEPRSSPRRAGSSRPLSSGVQSPAAGPCTGTSCSTALRPGAARNTAALATAIARAATSRSRTRRSVTSALR